LLVAVPAKRLNVLETKVDSLEGKINSVEGRQSFYRDTGGGFCGIYRLCKRKSRWYAQGPFDGSRLPAPRAINGGFSGKKTVDYKEIQTTLKDGRFIIPGISMENSVKILKSDKGVPESKWFESRRRSRRRDNEHAVAIPK